MLMRMLVWPGAMFWYEVSLTALFCLPTFLYLFLYDLSEQKRPKEKFLVLFITALIVIPSLFDLYLDKPILELLPSSQMVFHYHMDIRILIPIFLCCLILFLAIRFIWHQIHNTGYSFILAGMIILGVGNLISIFPGNVFPFDTLSGIINAGLVFWALYRRNLFDIHIFLTHSAINMITAAVLFTLTIPFSNALKPWITSFLGPLQDSLLFATFWLITVSITLLCDELIYSLVQRFFLAKEKQQSLILKDFSAMASQSRNEQKLCDKLIDSFKQLYGDRPMCLFLSNPEDASFVPIYPKELKDTTQPILSTDPCTRWFAKQEEPVRIKQIQEIGLIPTIDKQKMMKDYHIKCIIPFQTDHQLQGILFMGCENSRQDYTNDDLLFMNSLGSILSMGIKNARLYTQLVNEATCDQLTDLLNRRAFRKILEERIQENLPFSLVMIDLDDFKLYNQLYGTTEGDHALRRLATLLQKSTPENAVLSRYSGKVLIALLPNVDGMEALAFAQQLKHAFQKIMEQQLIRLTFSCGVFAYHDEKITADRMMECVDMAVYEAKQSGKNTACLYKNQKNKAATQSLIDSTSTIYAITAAIDAKDHYTFSHSLNVANYAKALAQALGMDEFHVQMIYQAGLVHDVGKLAIPEQILSKPGYLTHEEFEIMKSHVESSVPIIRNLPSLDYVLPSAITHHERWDGTGYPRGLKGAEIPIGGRCLALADAYDAITSRRSYKPAYDKAYAIEQIKQGAGTQFDPELCPVFISLIQKGILHPEETR